MTRSHEDQSGALVQGCDVVQDSLGGGQDFGEDTVRLFVSNLTYSCTSSELEAAFSRFGKVAQVRTFEASL